MFHLGYFLIDDHSNLTGLGIFYGETDLGQDGEEVNTMRKSLKEGDRYFMA